MKTRPNVDPLYHGKGFQPPTPPPLLSLIGHSIRKHMNYGHVACRAHSCYVRQQSGQNRKSSFVFFSCTPSSKQHDIMWLILLRVSHTFLSQHVHTPRFRKNLLLLRKKHLLELTFIKSIGNFGYWHPLQYLLKNFSQRIFYLLVKTKHFFTVFRLNNPQNKSHCFLNVLCMLTTSKKSDSTKPVLV